MRILLLLSLLLTACAESSPLSYVGPYAQNVTPWASSVDAIYMSLLHRHATTDDIQALWPNLIGEPPTLATVRARVVASPEYQQR